MSQLRKGCRSFKEGSTYRLHLVGKEGLSLEAMVSFMTLPTKVVLGPALGQSTRFASQPHRVMTCLTPWATASQGETTCDLECIIDL